MTRQRTGAAPTGVASGTAALRWYESLSLALYGAALGLIQGLLRRKLRQRARREPVYAENVAQRFGQYGPETGSPGGFLWIHAVSLGETHVAATLLGPLRLALPGMRLLLTHGTATGREAGRRLLQSGDVQVWQPWDTPAATRRFVQQFRPCLGLLMETEVWPTLVHACVQAGVPLCLVNARLSAKSWRQAQRLAWLSVPAYRGLRAVWAQTEDDAQRLRRLGAPVDAVLGSLKFDTPPNAAQCAQGQHLRQGVGRPVLLFASSRATEEQMLLDALRVRQSLPGRAAQATTDGATGHALGVQWLVVPRHPQRFDAVAELCEAAGFTVSRRSVDGSGFSPADIWLGDSLGEMALYLGLADVALLGGSFAPLGGQNLIEAAACGCPVVMGPHTFNFAQAAALAQAEGAAFAVEDMVQAVATALRLAKDPPMLERASSESLAFAARHQGAAQRTCQRVAAIWSDNASQASGGQEAARLTSPADC